MSNCVHHQRMEAFKRHWILNTLTRPVYPTVIIHKGLVFNNSNRNTRSLRRFSTFNQFSRPLELTKGTLRTLNHRLFTQHKRQHKMLISILTTISVEWRTIMRHLPLAWCLVVILQVEGSFHGNSQSSPRIISNFTFKLYLSGCQLFITTEEVKQGECFVKVL